MHVNEQVSKSPFEEIEKGKIDTKHSNSACIGTLSIYLVRKFLL